MKKLMRAIADFCYFHHRSILISFFLSLAFLTVSISELKIETNFLKLFPQRNTSVGAFVEILDDFDSLDRLYLLVKKKKSLTLNEFIAEAETFIAYLRTLRINGDNAFKDISYMLPNLDKHEDMKNLLSLFMSNPLHFIDRRDLFSIEAQLDKEKMFTQLSKARKSLVGLTSYALKDYTIIDPLSLRWIIEKKIKNTNSEFHFDTDSGYLLSADQQSLLIITSLAQSSQDMNFSKKLMHAIMQYEPLEKNIEIFCAGASAVAVSNEMTIKQDITRSLIVAFFGVFLLFYIVYRRFVILVFVSLPIIFGILSAFAFASLAFGSINILTSAFSAIVVGLGIDFSIHLYDRFHSERARGKDTREALHITLEQTGRGVLTGGLTTICAFLSLYSANIEAIQHFGLLIAIGIGSCLLSTYFILPALLVWVDKTKGYYFYKPLKNFGLSHLTSYLEKYSTIVLLVSLLCSIFMLYYCTRLSFENDTMSLRPSEDPSYLAQKMIQQDFGNRSQKLFISKKNNDLNRLIALEDQLIEILEKSKERGEVESYGSVGMLLNAEEKQKVLLKSLTNNINFDETSRIFDLHLATLGFNTTLFQPTRTLLTTLREDPLSLITSPNAMLNLLKSSSMLHKIIDMYVVEKGGKFTIITPLFLEEGKTLTGQLIQDIEKIDATIQMVGIPIINQEIVAMVKGDLLKCFLLAVCLILLCLIIHFRSTTLVLLSLIPILMGMLWMLGSMAFFGVRFNFINTVILPMIIGIGIDDGVHIIHRYRENRVYDMKETLSHTGRAVIMTSLTTIISFGTLVTASHNALAIMGLVTILGIVFCLINSLITLPSLLILVKRKV